jgi:hypothetical protein
VAARRHITGGLASVLVHGGLLAWAVGHEPARVPTEPTPVAIELLDVTAIAGGPLAWEATAGAPDPDATPTPASPRGDAGTVAAEPEPPTTRAPRRTAPSRARDPRALPADPAPLDDEVPLGPPTPPEAVEDQGRASRTAASGTSDGRGSAGPHDGRMGTGEGPDHSAYGAELVRLVKAEIDLDPVPGLRSRDSIEVVLEVLPSGRLARRGLGRYDYARVVHSTVGPVRMRAILRRILRASERFPPHPSSFPRTRYVVGFTVRFRDRHG